MLVSWPGSPTGEHRLGDGWRRLAATPTVRPVLHPVRTQQVCGWLQLYTLLRLSAVSNVVSISVRTAAAAEMIVVGFPEMVCGA